MLRVDDAEVVPPAIADVATGFTPGRIAGLIAPKGIIAGSTRSLRGNADDAEVVPPEESAGLRKRRRHGARLRVCGRGAVADDAEVVSP